jgi:hypothetical protein
MNPVAGQQRYNPDTHEFQVHTGTNWVNIEGAISWKGPEGEWQRFFTWKPVKIRKRWYWLKHVFRRDKNRMVIPHQGYEYGTAFDVIRDS